MKNVKNILTLVLISTVSLYAAGDPDNKSVYPDNMWKSINFELINKSNADIYVSLQGAKSVQFYTLNSNLSNWQQVGQDRGYVKVPAGSTLSASIDTTPTLVLSVAKDWKSNVPSGIMGYKLYPAGKTVYLS